MPKQADDNVARLDIDGESAPPVPAHLLDLDDDALDKIESERERAKPVKKGKEKEPEPEEDEDDPEEEDEDDPEEEDEDDPEEEDEDDKPAAKTPKKDDKQQSIPLARFNKVIQRRKDAESRAEQAEQELAALKASMSEKTAEKVEAKQQELDELYENVEKARAIGDFKESAKLQRKIDAINAEATKNEAKAFAINAALQQSNAMAFNAVVDELFALAPQFDAENEAEFDEAALQELKFNIASFEKSGMAPAAALKRAAKYVLGRDVFSKSIKRDEKPIEKRGSVKKNLEALDRTPPDINDTPANKPRTTDVETLIRSKSVDAMTDADLDKLEREVGAPKAKRRSAG